MKQVMRFHQQEEKMININVSNNKNPLTERQQAADDILFSLQPKRR